MKTAAAPAQITFGFAPIITPRGDGTFTVAPGKPITWLGTTEAARYLHIAPNTLRGWIESGTLPRYSPDGTELCRLCGKCMWEFNVPAVRRLMDHWTNTRLNR